MQVTEKDKEKLGLCVHVNQQVFMASNSTDLDFNPLTIDMTTKSELGLLVKGVALKPLIHNDKKR